MDLLNLLLQESGAVSETPQHDENAFSNLSDNQDHNTPSHTHTSTHPTSDAVSDTSSPVIKDVLEDLNDVDLNKFDDVSGAHSLIHFTHSLTYSLINVVYMYRTHYCR